MKQSDPFYKTKRWEMKRQRILRRDGYQCQISKRYGRQIQATTVHHIFPREEFPQFAFEDWNLISLAAAVHDELHDRRTGTLTQKGEDLLRRTARREHVRIPEKYSADSPRH